MKCVFVILHYLTDQDTTECIESILSNCDMDKCAIVIVDNNSKNGSVERLQIQYGKTPNVDILQSKENLGFAKGNNLGIDFARKKYNPDFVIACNNDILVLQENICEVIEEEYQKYGFAVMGPMIMSPEGHCNINPLFGKVYTMRGLEKLIKTEKKILFLNKLHLLGIYQFLGRIKNAKQIKSYESDAFIRHKVDTRLQGSFLVFSREFFRNYDGFYKETFLYLEEDILFYQVLKANLHTLYSPRVMIYHKEDSASNEAWKDLDKVDMKERERLESAKVFLKLMKECGEF